MTNLPKFVVLLMFWTNLSKFVVPIETLSGCLVTSWQIYRNLSYPYRQIYRNLLFTSIFEQIYRNLSSPSASHYHIDKFIEICRLHWTNLSKFVDLPIIDSTIEIILKPLIIFFLTMFVLLTFCLITYLNNNNDLKR